VIPADDKPYARLVAAGAIAHALREINPQYPTVSAEAKAALEGARATLLTEAPAGAPADPDDPAAAAKAPAAAATTPAIAAATGTAAPAADGKRVKDKGKKKSKH
jgi:hypothetical protein